MTRSLRIAVFVACVASPAIALFVGAFNSKAKQAVRLARIDGVTMYVPASLDDDGQSAARVTETDLTEVPRAKFAEREYDFGIVEPMRAHRHRFLIENIGKAPLKVSKLGTSCKCVKVDVIDSLIPARKKGEVEVTWEALPTQAVFLQRATIETNDPAHAKIDLKIAGQVRVLVGAEPPVLSVSRIKPNETAHAETIVVSQVWDKFTIEDLKSSLSGLTWNVTPADRRELARFKARSGWRIAVTFPTDMPTGSFKEILGFTARPVTTSLSADSSSEFTEPLVREIPVEGTVLRRLAVYGKDIQPWGIIEAGTIDSSQGYQAEYMLKVNDNLLDLTTSSVETSPSFVEAHVTSYDPVKKPGLYRLRVHIPPSGHPGNYQGDRRGKIRLTFDHPRIKTLDLGIEFVVVKDSHRQISEFRSATPRGS